MPDLDPAGLEAAAKAMTLRWNMPSISWENYVPDAHAAITAYLTSSDLTRLTAVAMNELTKQLNEVCEEREEALRQLGLRDNALRMEERARDNAEAERDRMRETARLKNERLLIADGVIAGLEREVERLMGCIDACVTHVDLLSRAFGGASKLYTCALCGAGPNEDHTPQCELKVHRALLAKMAPDAALAHPEGAERG